MSWEIEQMTGFRINSPLVVRDPNCPTGRHPHNACRCRVFKRRSDAEAYIRELS